MTEMTAVKAKRPTSITVICILGFIGALISVPVLFTGVGDMIGAWYTPYMALSVVVGLASVIGMWMMKKWGGYLYIAMFVINQIVLLVTGTWNLFSLVIPAIVVFFIVRNLNKMD